MKNRVNKLGLLVAVLLFVMPFTGMVGAASVEDVASSFVITDGVETNDYTYTHTQDDSYHQLTEVVVGGPSGRPYQGLSVSYGFDISAGTEAPYTLYIDAYRSGSESFEVFYQINGAGYTSLGLITATSDTDTYLSLVLPGVVAEDSVDVQIVDTERVKSEPADTVFVDHLYIESSEAAQNQAPDAPSNPSPVDGATGVYREVILTVTGSDPDGDLVNVAFYDASDDSLIDKKFNIGSGYRVSVVWYGLSADTTYSWYAIADDWVLYSDPSPTWSFTTAANMPPNAPVLPGPGDGAVDVPVDTTVNVHVQDPDGDTLDVTFYDASGPTLIGTDYGVPSGSPASVPWTGLSGYTTYFWYAVSYDGEFSTQSATWSFVTGPGNDAPPNAPISPDPADGATDVDVNPTLGVYVTDPDGNSMDVSFYDDSDDSLIATDTGVASGTTASVSWNGLIGDTPYSWYTIADDGKYATQSTTWSFTTVDSGPFPAPPTDLTVEWWGLGGAPVDTATTIIMGDGIQTNSYTDTWTQNDFYHQITEVPLGGGGNSEKGFSIYYAIPTTTNPAPYTLYIDAYRTGIEDIEVSYSVNGGPYELLKPISASGDNDVYVEHELLGIHESDTVTVKFQDNIRERFEPADTLYIDHMYIGSAASSGSPTDDNTLNWTLSADDGAGDNDVTEYVIYRSNYHAGPWDATTQIATVPAGTDTYLDENFGEADQFGWWYVVRAKDSEGYTEANMNNVKEPGNGAPNSIWEPFPTSMSTGASTNPTLKVRVYDPDEDIMDVYIYDAFDNSLITVDYYVPSGLYTMAQWTGLDEYTSYTWYVVADDGVGTLQSNTWTFTTGSNDNDGDVLQNDDETTAGTNLNIVDTDGDGFTDFEEVEVYGSNAITVQNWVGYFVSDGMYSLIQADVEDYVAGIAARTGISTQLFQGSWADQYALRAAIETQYANGMVGAVLVGNDLPAPHYLFDNQGYGVGSYGDEFKVSDLFYMDMDGEWENHKPYNFYQIDFDVYDGTTKASIYHPSSSYNYYVGAGGKLLRKSYYNPEMAPIELTSGTLNDLYAIDHNPSTATSLFVGAGGTFKELTAGDMVNDKNSGTSSDLFGLEWHPGWNYAFMVGGNGVIKKYTESSGSVTDIDSGVTATLRDVTFDASGNDALAVGDGGTVLLIQGDNAVALSSGVANNLKSVDWIDGDSYALIVGEGGLVLKYDGTFTTLDLGTIQNLNGIAWSEDEAEALIVGNAGLTIRYEASGAYEALDSYLTNDAYFAMWEDSSQFPDEYAGFTRAHVGGSPATYNWQVYAPDYPIYHTDGEGDVAPDMWLGSLRPPTFEMNAQATYLQQYFARALDYLDGTLASNEEFLSYADRTDFGHLAMEAARNAQDAYAVEDFTIVHDEDATADDYLWRLENEDYEMVYLATHGSETYEAIYGGGVYSPDIHAIDTRGLFYTIYSCSNHNYLRENYIGGEYVFSSNYTLGSFSSGKTGGILEEQYYFTLMNEDYTMGTSILNWFNKHGMSYESMGKEAWFGAMAYIGDPILRN